MGWSRSVISEMVASVEWEATSEDQQLGNMIVTFKKGRRALYSDVPEAVADQLARAPSVGQYMNMEIKPYYAFRYV